MDTETSHPMPPLLEVRVPGQPEPLRFTGAFRIGRDEGNDVVVDDPIVSERHAEVVFEDDAWWIRDLGSTNGLFLRGSRIDRVPVAEAAELRLGPGGPVLQFRDPRRAAPRSTVAVDPKADHLAHRYFSTEPPENMGRHTAMVRRIFHEKRKATARRYWIALAVLGAVGAGASVYAYGQRQEVARQRAAAVDLFYAIKALELEVDRLRQSAAEQASYVAQRNELEQRYRDFVEELGIYGDGTPERKRLIYQIVHRFGESEVNVPPEFIGEVERYIERWRVSGRLPGSIARATESGYGPRIAQIMLGNNLPPEFFYLALQESQFNLEAIGPATRFGFAKGMWQFLPGTARQYGLKTGPLVGEPRPDPLDERHDFEKATRAAAEYLWDIYSTDAQASGLLVVAAYNWGQTNVLRLIRSMPETPRERNFWNLLTKYRDRIPTETYHYVFSIVSAAVIGENPELFGFDFPPPIPERLEQESAVAGVE